MGDAAESENEESNQNTFTFIHTVWVCLPSKACCTLLFKDCVLVALAEDGPPDDGGLEVKLIGRVVNNEKLPRPAES